MKPEVLIAGIKKDFEFISAEVEGVLLYGSHAKGSADRRSDIDICIIKPKKREVLNLILAKVGGKYDVKIFEDLPLYVKMDIIENCRVIYGSEPEISYYFYLFRKKWDDMKYRIMNNSYSSAAEMAAARRKWFDAKRQISIKA